jgi:hypothetical protein
LRIEGVAYPSQRIPTVVNFGFLDRSRYFLEKAPELSSRGWVDPVPDPLLLRKSGSAGNRTQTSGSVGTDKAVCGPGNTEQQEMRNFRSGVLSAETVRIIVLFAV